MYVVMLDYPSDLTAVDAALPAHADWLATGYERGLVLTSGRRVPRVGGVILVRDGVQPDELERWLTGDPFKACGVVHRVIRFDPGRRAADFPAARSDRPGTDG